MNGNPYTIKDATVRICGNEVNSKRAFTCGPLRIDAVTKPEKNETQGEIFVTRHHDPAAHNF